MKRSPANAPASAQPNANFSRLNRMQIKEQEALNRERQREDEFQRERKDRIVQSQKSKYSHVQSHAYGKDVENVTPPRGNSDDVEIQVFVRECDPDAQAFAVMESECVPVQSRAPQQQHHGPQSAHSPKGPLVEGPRPTVGGSRRDQGQHAAGEIPRYLQQRKAELQAAKEEQQRLAEEQAEQAQAATGGTEPCRRRSAPPFWKGWPCERRSWSMT